jgi:peptide/nickel transport system substrate-binding protein
MKQKTAWIMLGALALVIALAGCGKKAPTASGYKDTLTWAQYADITSLDPHIGKETVAVQVTNHIFDTLVEVDGEEVIPCIAESWEQISDVDYRFKIRRGIKFHDGSDLTAEDVKFSIDRAIATPSVTYIVDFIGSVTVEDPYTVLVTTKAPYAPTLRNLAIPFAAIVPKAYVEKDPNILAQKPIGSGPYKFISWSQSDSARFEAFDEYWGGPPKTKNLIMRVIPEASQRTIALQTGEVDLAYDIPANDLRTLEQDTNLNVYRAQSLTCLYITVNLRKSGPLQNKLVRQAISHAIDRQLIIDTILSGAGQAADAIIAPPVFGYYSTGPDKYDPELSKSLLTQAGLPKGFSCTLWVNNAQDRVEVCQAVVEMLREVGIDCRLEVMEFGAFIQRITAGEHDLGFFGWITSSRDGDYTYYALDHSSQQGAAGNRSFLNDPAADKLIEAGRTITDPEQRLVIYKELTIYLADVANNINIAYTHITAGGSKKVDNFVLDPIGYHKLEGVQVRQ